MPHDYRTVEQEDNFREAQEKDIAYDSAIDVLEDKPRSHSLNRHKDLYSRRNEAIDQKQFTEDEGKIWFFDPELNQFPSSKGKNPAQIRAVAKQLEDML